MADTSNAAAADEQDQQITINIKSSADTKYVVTVPLSSTVAELKQKLSTSEYANLPPERQRLIYSGRVLKDHDSMTTCKIKDGNTVHLVRGAESNSRQNPANQSGGASVPPGAGQPASNVPTNLAAGTSASNPLDQLTGARYAGFHGLPGMDMFGTDGGMGAPPNPDQMLRMLDDPNFAQQMNEAMNNPAVIDMLRNNPMIRNNPIAREAIDNPAFRRMMMNPDMIRMQMQMQRAMGGDGMGGGASAFPMPGQTDTTPAPEGAATGDGTSATPGQTNTTGTPNSNPQPGANPFAALFGGAGGAGAGQGQNQTNPFGSLFGQPAGGNQGSNPLAAMTQQLMQNPQMMQQMMQMMNGLNNPGSPPTGDGNTGTQQQNPFGGLNPFMFGNMFGGEQQQPQQPPDNRPPEERYAEQLRQLNDMGFYEFERNIQALRRSGGSVQGAVEYLLSGGT